MKALRVQFGTADPAPSEIDKLCASAVIARVDLSSLSNVNRFSVGLRQIGIGGAWARAVLTAEGIG
jgi:hypothetical protein